MLIIKAPKQTIFCVCALKYILSKSVYQYVTTDIYLFFMNAIFKLTNHQKNGNNISDQDCKLELRVIKVVDTFVLFLTEFSNLLRETSVCGLADQSRF